MRFIVYVLFSPSRQKSYVGQTENLEIRIRRHNAGLVRSTRPSRPWICIHSETYTTRAEALRRESHLKTPTGRRELVRIFEQWQAHGIESSPLPPEAEASLVTPLK
jgi:putative endonuclease